NHRCQVVALADDEWKVQRLDIRAGAVGTAGRVDHDDSSACEKYAEEARDVSGLVAQQDPDLILPNHERLDGLGEPGDLAPRRPVPVVLDGCGVRLQVQHVGEAPAERVIGHQRTLGLAASRLPWAASSAWSRGFPSL